ncbi:DUF2771 domain-containing protein [Corynebacterium sp. ES2794-CONJ1]|uniref:DUF2771 domain-containing protein n=1 Tax=unclassified Corynebacterium TaxID=2624378 RepID=UPI00216A7A2C|nr:MULTISPECIES: DUF2771 domain-containing protein [unclassified Corynebacterium]MCS4490061.1 DUF2771 domain-containing protein [Corynebacterium sp. ES2775-CONJ]MCS4491577.1 DUF2771 domain-containing protein [Corynebacterium sp. ES2715-CONJ3]MCS4531681.1 DUF2771 domain-containing protein [Corynebacterium sp. ES2730-CONJ]MCU9519077.1 DUF2771 domain-containing protein [Corynebacterium sp. ES2794-CONJ1]
MRPKTKKTIVQVAGLGVAVLVVLITSIAFQNWWNNRPGTAPEDLKIQAQLGSERFEVPPYSVCELGEPCREDSPTLKDLSAANELVVDVPRDIYDHDWTVLSIYDDPAHNSEFYFGPYEKKHIEIPTTNSDAELLVVEIKSVLIGRDADGAETPLSVVWSVGATKKPAS